MKKKKKAIIAIRPVWMRKLLEIQKLVKFYVADVGHKKRPLSKWKRSHRQKTVEKFFHPFGLSLFVARNHM